MDKKILRFLFRLMIFFFVLIFGMGFFSEILKPMMLPNVNVAVIGNMGITRRVKQTSRIEPLHTESMRSLQSVEVMEVFADAGAAVAAGDPVMRVRIRTASTTQTSFDFLERQIDELHERLRNVEYQLTHGHLQSAQAWEAFSVKDRETLVMERLNELGVISNQEWQAWIFQREELAEIWDRASVDESNAIRWKEAERKLILERLQRLRSELEEIRSHCAVLIDDKGLVYAPVEGIVIHAAAIGERIDALAPMMEIAEVTDYSSVKLVTEISLSEYQWIGDNLLVYVRTPKGLLKTYTKNIYRTDHQTVVFESLFNKAYTEEVRLGQTYDTMIERQQRFLGTVTIPKTLITAPGGFYNRGIGTVKIIRQESGILGDEFFVEEVPIRMVVVGDERVITLPLHGLVALNADDLEPGTKVYVNQ